MPTTRFVEQCRGNSGKVLLMLRRAWTPPQLTSLIMDPACALGLDRKELVWSNVAFDRTFKKRAETLVEAMGGALTDALAPVLLRADKRWSEVVVATQQEVSASYLALAMVHEGAVFLLLRDTLGEANVHLKYKRMLERERERQRELENEIERRIRQHEDDLAQFSEVAQMGPQLIYGFLNEARQQVATARELVSRFQVGVVPKQEDVVVLARTLHSLKGNARTVGLNLLGGRAHHAEDVVRPLLGNPMPVSDWSYSIKSVVEDLDRLVDRGFDLHQRLAAPGGRSQASVLAALIHLADAAEAVVATGMEPEGSGPGSEDLRRSLEEANAALAVPVADLLETARQTAKVAAAELGKEVEIQVRVRPGALVPRRFVGVLETCLGHVVRNAVAHGIEAPDRRVEKGKAPTGVVTLEASEGLSGKLRIVVEDDGAGIDSREVLRRAQALGLRPNSQVEIAVEEAVQLIMTAGFSTTEQANLSAGRGMGLDAVAEELRSVGGQLAFRPVSPHGTQIELSVPVAQLG